MSFIKVQDRKLVRAGQPIHLRGLNIGNYMQVEYYMIGLPWTEYKMRAFFRQILGEQAFHAFWDTYMEVSMAEADFAFIKSCGFNLVALPMNYRHFLKDGTTGGFDPKGFALVDRFIALARQQGLYVMLSLHAAPGVQARDWNAESLYGEAYFWDHEFFRRQTIQLWQEIAARYKDEPQVAGYKILNEPLCPDQAVFHRFNMDTTRAIREVDPNHVLIVSSNYWGKIIDNLEDELFEDEQIMPCLHCYHSQFAPFGQMRKYPGIYRGKKYGREEFAAILDPSVDEKRIPRPYFVGEFGVYTKAPNLEAQFAMLDELTGIFNERGYHWAFWDYKDLGDMGLVFPMVETPWAKFVNREDVVSLRRGYHRSGQKMKAILKKAAPEMEDSLGHLLGQSAHHWDALALPLVLEKLKACSLRDLEAMARSFAFENCQVHPEKHAILTKYALEGKDV